MDRDSSGLPPSLERDLLAVAALYGCTPQEVELMRQLAAANPVAARSSYFALAREARGRIPPT